MFKRLFMNKDLAKGIAFMKERQFEAAKEQFLRLCEGELENPEAYFNLAKAYYYLKAPQKLKDTLLHCLTLNPDTEIIRGILEITNWTCIASPCYYNHAPVWSRDGSWLAYPSAREDTDRDGEVTSNDRSGLYIYDMARRKEWPILSQEFHNTSPAFSPEGRRLLYLSSRRDTNGDGQLTAKDQGGLYLSDLDTGKEKLLVSDEYKVKFPTFTPDGNAVIFCGWRTKNSHSGIYLLDLKTGHEKLLVSQLYESTFPNISPDGSFILYSSWREDTNKDGRIDLNDNSAIYLLDFQSRAERPLTGNRWSNSYPVWSSDGNTFAYLSRRRDTNYDGKIDSLDNSAIVVSKLSSRKERVIVSDQYYNKFPGFTADGKAIVFVGSWRRSDRADYEEVRDYFENKGIYAVDIEGKKTRQIVSDKFFGCRFLAPAPRGSKIAYIAWGKGTGRGLYYADTEQLPDQEELAKIVQENL